MTTSKKYGICHEIGHNKLKCKKRKQSKGTILTTCNHSFCFTCFMEWISKNKRKLF